MRIPKKNLEWLRDDKNLNIIKVLWPIIFGLFGGAVGLGYWVYDRSVNYEKENTAVIDINGEKVSSQKIKLKTVLMLREIGNLRLEDGDFIGAEKNFDDALELLDRNDSHQIFYHREILFNKIKLYKSMNKMGQYKRTLEEYDRLFPTLDNQ